MDFDQLEDEIPAIRKTAKKQIALVEVLMELEGFGEKSINNLLENIEISKNNSLEKLLFGLGIRHVGKKTAKILSEYYTNIDKLINTSVEELSSIPDIGDVILHFSILSSSCATCISSAEL